MTDAMLYFVQVDLGRLGLVWLERSDCSRKTLIRDLRSREIQDVTAILECNPVEHVCSDVTKETLEAANVEAIERVLSGEELQETLADFIRDRRKHEVA